MKVVEKDDAVAEFALLRTVETNTQYNLIFQNLEIRVQAINLIACTGIMFSLFPKFSTSRERKKFQKFFRIPEILKNNFWDPGNPKNPQDSEN